MTCPLNSTTCSSYIMHRVQQRKRTTPQSPFLSNPRGAKSHPQTARAAPRAAPCPGVTSQDQISTHHADSALLSTLARHRTLNRLPIPRHAYTTTSTVALPSGSPGPTCARLADLQILHVQRLSAAAACVNRGSVARAPRYALLRYTQRLSIGGIGWRRLTYCSSGEL